MSDCLDFSIVSPIFPHFLFLQMNYCLNFGSSYFLFLGFHVHFREEDKDDLEQECPAEIVLVLCSLSYRVTDRALLDETFSADNCIAQSPANEKQNAIGRQKMFQPIAYDQRLYRRREWRTKTVSARHFYSRSMSPS